MYELDKTVPVPLGEVFASVASMLESTGMVVARTGPGDGQALVRAVVGSGAMNLNPAVITVSMTSAADGSTILHIHGAAKEGLIKQHAGEKAAKRFGALLD